MTESYYVIEEDEEFVGAVIDAALARARRILAGARAGIDEEFGEGFAAKNPEILKVYLESVFSAVESDLLNAEWDEDEDDEDGWEYEDEDDDEDDGSEDDEDEGEDRKGGLN